VFESLSTKLQDTFRKLSGHGKITEKNVADSLREVKLALLEADVNYKVVKDFIQRVQEQSLGQAVLSSISPGQQIVKIVHQELIKLMGEADHSLRLSPTPPTVIMLVGLQGSGKTTTAAKLARRLHKEGQRPMLVPADPYRPAAADQLRILADQLGLPCAMPQAAGQPPLVTCQKAVALAKQGGQNILIVDTAGRLHIDDELMQELIQLKAALNPQHVLLVADAMTGQEAVKIAESFHKGVGLTGIILSKLEGDARGGAALSIRAVTNCPIQFVGLGEKLDALEPFHPERMASRILGMGDVLSLVEKAQSVYDEKQAQELEQKLRKQQYSLEDFLGQLRQIKKMGPLEQLMGMLPGFDKVSQGMQVDDKQMGHTEAIICSMTPEERRNSKIINGSRRMRIAKGSGTSIQEVNRLLKQFTMMQDMFKKFSKAPKRSLGRMGLPGLSGFRP